LSEKMSVSAKLDLEELLYDLSIENLDRARSAKERNERYKYSAATIVFAQAAVEGYFNWILEHKMLSYNYESQPIRRLLGETINDIRNPALKRWTYILEAVAFLATGKLVEPSKDFEKNAKKLNELRNYVIHYDAKLRPTERLPKTDEGIIIWEKLTLENAEKSVEIARELIKELHKKEGTNPPQWISASG